MSIPCTLRPLPNQRSNWITTHFANCSQSFHRWFALVHADVGPVHWAVSCRRPDAFPFGCLTDLQPRTEDQPPAVPCSETTRSDPTSDVGASETSKPLLRWHRDRKNGQTHRRHVSFARLCDTRPLDKLMPLMTLIILDPATWFLPVFVAINSVMGLLAAQDVSGLTLPDLSSRRAG